MGDRQSIAALLGFAFLVMSSVTQNSPDAIQPLYFRYGLIQLFGKPVGRLALSQGTADR
jgi:hypothetical protein